MKAQTAVEFAFLIGFMLLVFISFFFIIQEKIIRVTQEQDLVVLNEISNILYSEVQLAGQVNADYHRDFFLPTTAGVDISLTDPREITVADTLNNVELVRFLNVEVKGRVHLGTNRIHKVDGYIQNPASDDMLYEPDYSGIFMNINPEVCWLYTLSDADGAVDCDGITDWTEDPDYAWSCKEWFGLCPDAVTP